MRRQRVDGILGSGDCVRDLLPKKHRFVAGNHWEVLNYGDVGMTTETKGTLSFSETAYENLFMKRSMKAKDIGYI